MKNILAEIVSNKQKEIDLRQQQRPLANFIDQVKISKRSLKKALSNKHSDFILEIKKASPSKGLIRNNFDLEQIIDSYQHYASAVSVLTDETYFQGCFEYLKKASERLTQPILCKDFIIEPYQIFEARYYGADAILLMLSVLDNDQYLMLASVASELNLDILTEVHNEEELLRALKLEANIIGINNRNLKDLSVDLSVTEKLVPLIPKDKIVIAESGISNHQDVLRLAPKVNGFLVGSSLMAENDIESRCKVLLFGQVKICGITRMEDAQAVHASGGSYLGFIFYPKSKRYIQPNEAKKIIDALPIKSVGVFVDEKPEDLIAIAQDLKLDVIQLHGDESDDDIKNIKAHLPDIKIWKAIHVDNPNDLENMDFDSSLIDRYLLDTYSTSEKGGTGKAFNWEWLNDLPMDKIILAGGINLDNIQQARRLKPFAIDLSSGVEICPGIKSSEKLTQLFKSLRA